MTMNLSNLGAKNAPTKLNVNIDELPTLTCQECEGTVFIPVMMFKKVSALIAPDGQEQLLPMQIFQCCNCGTVPEDFLP